MKLLFVSLLSGMIAIASYPAHSTFSPEEPRERVRAMWVWQTNLLLESHLKRAAFLAESARLGLTDAYLYLQAADYSAREDELSVLIEAMADAGVRAWGLEGWRGYFPDAEGPADLFAAADALIAYNKRQAVGFVGFHSNLEPQDGQGVGLDLFVNGVAESRLTPDEYSSRARVLSDWVELHEQLFLRMAAGRALYGATMPSWVDDYYGEPVSVEHRGEYETIISHILPLVSQYIIMSYNTDTSNVMKRILGEIDYAEGYDQPKIMFSLEVHPGVGKNVSYADSPSKDRQSFVISDLGLIEKSMNQRSSYLGWSIHDWEGWAALDP